MEFVIVVLSKVECLEDFLTRLADEGITGATILDSTGMAKVLSQQEEDHQWFGSLRLLFNPSREESKTVFSVLTKEQVPLLKKAFTEVVGDINAPNTGVIIGLPISFTEGIGGLDVGK